MIEVHPLAGIVTSLAIGSFWLYFIANQFPDNIDGEEFSIYFPRNLKDLKSMSDQLRAYQSQNYFLVFVLFCSAYIYKQTFAIPGSVFMNLLGGALYGTSFGFPLVCLLTASGATICYSISKVFGKKILVQQFPERISGLQNKVMEHREELFFFILSARVFPMSPNWFMNMAFPIIGVPITPFFFSVLLGLIPYNFICIQTGAILTSITSIDDMLTWKSLLGLICVAVMAMLPGILMKKYKESKRKF